MPCEIEAEGKWGIWRRSIEKLSFVNTVRYAKPVTEYAKAEQERAMKGNDVVLTLFAYHGTGRLWAELNDKVNYTKQGSRLEGYEN